MKRTANLSRAIENTLLSLLVTLLVLLAFAPVVQAGIADSPLPVLQAGMETFHVYSVPSVIGGPGLATFFFCTSTDTASMQVGVEVFYSIGTAPQHNDPVATSLNLTPGGTVIFGTDAVAGVAPTYSNLGTWGLTQGSARILSTSEELTCTALIVYSDAPQTSAWPLPIVKRTTHKGD
jgi:hypothetical protein